MKRANILIVFLTLFVLNGSAQTKKTVSAADAKMNTFISNLMAK